MGEDEGIELKNFYYWLPDEFWTAYDSGMSYTFDLDEMDSQPEMYLYDDDDDRWSRMWMHLKYTTHSGLFFIEIYDDYECGDSELYEKRMVTKHPADAEWRIHAEFYKNAQEQLIRYCKWVAERGKDPLENFFGVQDEYKVTKTYQVKITTKCFRVAWVGWRRTKGAWRDPFWAPYYLHDYLGAKEHPYGFFLDDGGMTWDQALKIDGVRYLRGQEENTAAFEINLDEKMPNRHYERHLKNAARKYMYELEKEAKEREGKDGKRKHQVGG